MASSLPRLELTLLCCSLALLLTPSCGGGGEEAGGSGDTGGNGGGGGNTSGIRATPAVLTWSVNENSDLTSKTISFTNLGSENVTLNVSMDSLASSAEGTLSLSGDTSAVLTPSASEVFTISYTPPENVNGNQVFTSKLNQTTLTTSSGTVPLTMNVAAHNSFGEFDLPQSTDLTTITSAWTGFLANGSAESEMYWAGQNSADNLSDSTPFIGHAHADDQADGPPAKEWAFSYAASDASIDQEINAVIGLTGGGALAAGSYDQSGGDQGAWIFRVNDSGSIASWAEGAFTDSGDMIAEFLGLAEAADESAMGVVGSLFSTSAPFTGPGIAVLFDPSGNSSTQLTVGDLAIEDVDLEAIIPVNDGGWLVLGRVLENGESFYAGLVLKLDSNFSVVEWEMSYAASQDLSFIGALESADGSNFTLVGESFASSGPTITDLIQISSTDGSVVWKKQYAILGQDEVCSLYSLIEDGNSLWAFGHTDISNGSGGFTNLPLLLKINKGNGAIQIERNYSNMGDAFFVAGMNTLSANATAADFLITGIMDGDNQDAFAVYGLSENGVPSFVGGDCSSLTGVDNGVVSSSDLSLSALNRGDSSSLTTLTTTSVALGKTAISFSLKTNCPD